MKRIVVAAGISVMLVAGCGGGGGGDKTARLQGSGAQNVKRGGLHGTTDVAGTAYLSLPIGTKVLIRGGGASHAGSEGGSQCTQDETDDTFKITNPVYHPRLGAMAERHDFRFQAKSGGDCNLDQSWSWFGIWAWDPNETYIGGGQPGLWLGQYLPGAGFYLECRGGARQGKNWNGLICDKVGEWEIWFHK